MENSLRFAHLQSAKFAYKKEKAKKALDKGQITKEQYDKEIVMLDQGIENAPTLGKYNFK